MLPKGKAQPANIRIIKKEVLVAQPPPKSNKDLDEFLKNQTLEGKSQVSDGLGLPCGAPKVGGHNRSQTAFTMSSTHNLRGRMQSQTLNSSDINLLFASQSLDLTGQPHVPGFPGNPLN